MPQWKDRVISPREAASKIRSGTRIFLTGNCSTPLVFLQALQNRYQELHEVEIIKLLDLGDADYYSDAMVAHIRVNNLFIGANSRAAVNNGLADFTTVHLSEVPKLFHTGRYSLDVAVIQVTPPDAHGFCSYGVEVGVTKSAAEIAPVIIAEVNPNMPRTLGDSFIHVNAIDHLIEVDYELPEIVPQPLTEVQCQVAKHVAEMIPDGATLQTGIGGIPDAVLHYLTDHSDLGIHTELFSDGVIKLIESGVVTNMRKSLHPGKVVSGMVLGSRELFRYLHDNPLFEFHPTSYVNNPFVIAQNDRMVAINSAIEIDITGQICADSIGPNFYSGVGGQVDFIRGAAYSNGGMSFIAIPSTAHNGTVSRIVPHLKAGAGVTTSRNDVRFVATEFGVVDLWGLTINERVHALVNIAHPNFREDLMAYARKYNYTTTLYAVP